MNSKIAFVLLLIMAPPARACLVQEPLSDAILRRAQTVFIGEAVAYTPRPKFDPKAPAWKPAVIRFKVEKVLSGAAQKQIEVYWINGTFGESTSLEEFKKTFGPRTRVGVAAENPSGVTGFHDKPWVVQGPCTSPYMMIEI
jgi:hypothetical protein